MEPLLQVNADVEMGDDGDTKSAQDDDNSSDDEGEGASLKKKGEALNAENDGQSKEKVFLS